MAHEYHELDGVEVLGKPWGPWVLERGLKFSA